MDCDISHRTKDIDNFILKETEQTSWSMLDITLLLIFT